jgi:hypothetical protein
VSIDIFSFFLLPKMMSLDAAAERSFNDIQKPFMAISSALRKSRYFSRRLWVSFTYAAAPSPWGLTRILGHYLRPSWRMSIDAIVERALNGNQMGVHEAFGTLKKSAVISRKIDLFIPDGISDYSHLRLNTPHRFAEVLNAIVAHDLLLESRLN